MTQSIQDILKELSNSITAQGYAIEGLDLSYVDTKEKHLEIFTYSTRKYETAVRAGFYDKEIGSLLLSTETFKDISTIGYENKFLNIPESHQASYDKETPNFKEFSDTFSGNSNATHQKWINHYTKHQINGVYFFVGRRRKDDFDLVLFGVVNGNDKKEIKKKLRPIINKFLNKLNDFAIVFEKLRQHRNDIETAATRAAISQVMARNMSHNIGSHVMNAIIADDYLKNFCSFATCLKSYKPVTDILRAEEHCPYKQLAFYNNYVKTRMDYLADITFGTPVMLSTKNAYTDIFLELDKVRLLLDNISARGDKFKYNIQFVNGNNEALTVVNDIPLAIPNDVLGAQAFYNIIENLIRNTAKHSKTEVNKTHQFTIKIREIADSEIGEANDELKQEAQTLYCVEVFDNIKVDEKIITEQNKKIDTKILNESNELRSDSLGMIEMDASAAYLRQLDIVCINEEEFDVEADEKIYNSKGNFNILKAFLADSKDTDGKAIKSLGYRFFIKKPQLALIVTNAELEETRKTELAKIGITVLNNATFTDKLKSNAIFNHDFLVIEEIDEIKTTIKDKTAYLPHRVYFKGKECITNLPANKVTIETLWKWREDELLQVFKVENDVELDIYTYPELTKHNNKIGAKYADHLSQMQKETDELTLEEWKKETNDKFYFEALSSKGKEQLPKYNEIPNETDTNGVIKDKIPVYASKLSEPEFLLPKIKVAETMLSRIIVIDERIQEVLEEKLYKISYSEHYRMSNIYVPEKKNNLLDSTIEDCDIALDLKADVVNIGCINAYIYYIFTNNNIPFPFNPKYDFILVHYSLLERAFKDGCDGKSREECISDWLDAYKDNASIVVTSGRSNVKGLPEYVSFVNLSAVTTALKEIKSKYLLHQILYASRKTK